MGLVYNGVPRELIGNGKVQDGNKSILVQALPQKKAQCGLNVLNVLTGAVQFV